MFKLMNILVINSVNELGFNIINNLIKENHKVLSIDNIINDDNIKYALSIDNDNYSFYNGNILNEGFIHVKLDYSIKQLYDEKIDYIIYILDYNNYKNLPSLLFFDTCTSGMKNICYLSSKYKAKLLYVFDNEEINTIYKDGNNICNIYIKSYIEYCFINKMYFDYDIFDKSYILSKINEIFDKK